MFTRPRRRVRIATSAFEKVTADLGVFQVQPDAAGEPGPLDPTLRSVSPSHCRRNRCDNTKECPQTGFDLSNVVQEGRCENGTAGIIAKSCLYMSSNAGRMPPILCRHSMPQILFARKQLR